VESLIRYPLTKFLPIDTLHPNTTEGVLMQKARTRVLLSLDPDVYKQFQKLAALQETKPATLIGRVLGQFAEVAVPTLIQAQRDANAGRASKMADHVGQIVSKAVRKSQK